jgi:hypothetical protein
VHVLNRRLRVVHVVELHEPEAAAGVGRHVANNAARLDVAEAIEHALEGELVDVLGVAVQVAFASKGLEPVSRLGGGGKGGGGGEIGSRVETRRVQAMGPPAFNLYSPTSARFLTYTLLCCEPWCIIICAC